MSSIATRGRAAYTVEDAQKRVKSLPRLPKKNEGAAPLRQIGEHHWWAGVSVLEKVSHIKEITVVTHYNGWQYVLARTKNPYIFAKLTYYKGALLSVGTLSVLLDPSYYEKKWEEFLRAAAIMPEQAWATIPTYSVPLVRCASC
jgi:hypothetical protein